MRPLLLAVLLFFGCTNKPDSELTLRAAGYTRIEIGSWEFGCGEGDWYCTGFRAVGPTGVPARGVVGCGLMLKGCTIRVLP